MRMKNVQAKWIISLCIGAFVPLLIWFFFFRDPLVGNSGYRMSEFRKYAETFHMSTDDFILSDETDTRIKKTKHINPKDWQTTKRFLYSNNPNLRVDALRWITLVNQPEYRDEMIAAARKAMQDAPSMNTQSNDNLGYVHADIMQAHALRALWKKDAPEWRSEYQRLQALPHKGMMTKDFLEEIQAHQR